MPAYIDKYKNEFAIEFAKIMEKNLSEWKRVQAERRRSLYSFRAFLFYIGLSLISFFGILLDGLKDVSGDDSFLGLLYLSSVMALLGFVAAVFINIFVTNKAYQNDIKKTLFPKLLKVFGIIYSNNAMIDLTSDCYDCIDPEDITNIPHYINADILNNSKLYEDNITNGYIDKDDCFFGVYNNVAFAINEIPKIKHYKAIYFQGVAMLFKMNKQINSRVLILSKSQKIPKNYEKVNVEYEKFNKRYHVYTEEGGQIEARYLLNTAFLDRLMQIKTSFKVSKMKCSVYGNDLLIMLSTKRDLFEMNHLFGRIDDVTQYKTLFEEFASVLSFIDVLNLSSKTKL